MTTTPLHLLGPHDSLVSATTLAAASDDQLRATIAALHEAQFQRALLASDPDALAADAFDNAFAGNGSPGAPYVVDQVLICPGGKYEKSKTSHDCTFVAVGDTWVWEREEVLFDDLRQQPGSKWRRAVTILPAYEGLEFDVVSSQARGAAASCQMQSARSFVIKDGAVVETQVRTRSVATHR